MSHEYNMTIEVSPIAAADEDRVLDELCPRWWSPNTTKLDGDVLTIVGRDRLIGGHGPWIFREDLAAHLYGFLGYEVKVAVKGESLEEGSAGETFEHH